MGQGQQYDNTNRFVLFPNKKKQPGDNKPDYTGTFTDAEGVEFWISGWVKAPNGGGAKFLSGTVKPKEDAGAPPARQAAPQGRDKYKNAPPAENPIGDTPKEGAPFGDDDIPF